MFVVPLHRCGWRWPCALVGLAAAPALAQTVGTSADVTVDAKAYGGARCYQWDGGKTGAIAACASDGTGGDTRGQGTAHAAYGRLGVYAGASTIVYDADGAGTSVWANAEFTDRLGFNGLASGSSYLVTLLFPISGPGLGGNGFLDSGCSVQVFIPDFVSRQTTNGGPAMRNCDLTFTASGSQLRSFAVTAGLGVHVGAGGTQPGAYSAIGDYQHTMLLSGIALADAATHQRIEPSTYSISAASGTSYPIASVPEPATGWTLLAGLGVLGGAPLLRRRRSPLSA